MKLIVSCEFQYHYSTVMYPLNHKRLKYGFQWQIYAIIKYQTFKTKMSLTGTKTKTKITSNFLYILISSIKV